MTGRKRRSSKTGLPPGSLVHLGERKIEKTAISLIEYGPESFAERQFDSVAASRDFTPTQPVLWLNVYGLHEPEVMAEIGHRFKLHPLVLEDILNTDQRPKVEDYGDYLFLVARFFTYDEASATVASEQVSMVIGRRYVITFQERPTGNFHPIRDRLRQGRGQIRRSGADYLAYTLLDTIVDRYFAVLEAVGERSEELEEVMLRTPNAKALEGLHRLKSETLVLRRAIWPMREVINSLMRAPFFSAEVQPYLRDVYDHTVHLFESLETTRDLIASLLEIYLSTISYRVNREVRALTVIALIFMPSALLAGIFGMNFRFMPLIEEPLGFVLIIGTMVTIAGTLAMVFWRRRWLG